MDIEGTMQFIVEQQAKFSADIDILKEAVSRQGENISRLNDAIDEVVQSQKKMNEYLGQLTGVVASLADSLSTVEANQQMTSDNLIKLTEVVTKLADSVSTVEANQQMTSDNLIKLTEVVTKLADSVSTVEANQQMTSDNLIKLTEVVMKLADSLSGVEIKAVILEAQAESDRAEIREAVGKLISSEEETRRFAIEIAQLVKQHETRISQLENK